MHTANGSIRFIDQHGEFQRSLEVEIKRWGLSDGHKVITAFGSPDVGKNAFLNLVFGTDFNTDEKIVSQGVWLCGAKNGNAIVMNVEDGHEDMTPTMRSKCALLSIVFSDVLIFHTANNDYLHSIRFIIAIFDLVIHLSSKDAPERIGQTLLLFVITSNSLGIPMSNASSSFPAVLERTWAQLLSETTESADRRLYDHFDVSFMVVSPELRRSEWVKADITKPKARFFDKNRADYAFKPRYKKRFAVDKLGLCMMHLWLGLDEEDLHFSSIRCMIESIRRGGVPQTALPEINELQFSAQNALQASAAAKVDKGIQAGFDVHRKLDQAKEYADAEIQTQVDAKLRSNTSPLSSLLTILRKKKPGSPISHVVNVATIDLGRSLLRTKDYVNAALQLSNTSDVELLLDFMLHLLCCGHLLCLEVPDANRRARRLMLKMISKIPVMPSSLFVKGINAKVNYDCIGRGGFGFVFKGELGGTPVALKLIYKTRHNDDFCREALTWRSLNHEYVLPFLGIYQDELPSSVYLVSPYMKNGTLSQWRKKTNPLTLEMQRLMSEVAEGIQYIHSEGIVHGDIRGDNVLLDADFHAQISDFGLTRHSEATVTQSGALHYNFAAPELLGNWDEEEEDISESDDDGRLTTRTQKSDVYAFGCLYYEIQFDVIPFEGVHEMQIVKHVSRGNRPPRMDKPPLSDKAWNLIKRCWAKEAVRRPAMEDIVEKIMAWRSE